MAETQESLTWEKTTNEQFLQILEQIPALIRGIAEIRVSRKAEALVREQNRSVIAEKDMVDAFFSETPPGFIPAMKQSMEDLKIDYIKYGHGK